MIGFTANVKTEEEIRNEKFLSLVSNTYSDYFNATVVPEINEDAVSKTGALAKFVISQNGTLALSIIFPTGFASREVEVDRSNAKAVLTSYVSTHADQIKKEMMQLGEQIFTVNTALEEDLRSLNS